MLSLDGRDGGGHLVRTAVALGGVTDTAFEMTNVRGARDRPGLRPQHVAAVQTVADVAGAVTEGVAQGSDRFRFDPGTVRGGRFDAAIGTAGSIPLVFDAVLPLATRLEEPATVTVRGGTDVAWSPPIDYLRYVKLPTLSDVGVDATLAIDRRGFYPRGGGSATLSLTPSSLGPVDRDDRGALQSLAVYSVAASGLRSASVADRQADAAAEALADPVDAPIETAVDYVDSLDDGSVLVLVATYEETTAGFSALGERGKPSEDVANAAVERFEAFRETEAAVDPNLADQLVPYLALAGGRVSIPTVTDHVRTAVDLVRAFGREIKIDESGGDPPTLEAPIPDRQGTTP
ncbi:MAG: RNA 3'-terminal phosphate cyclase [Halanaeroarchaeum sp.]